VSSTKQKNMTRIALKQIDPAGYKAMLAFDAHLENSSLTVTEKNLIKIRVSQLNGCAYCVDMHTQEAREAGESERRLYGLTNWRDTPFFTESECAMLSLAEEVTMIHQRVSDATYQQALKVLGEKKLAHALMAAIVMNGWNRIGVSLEMMPAPLA
jgi:AhpD family alkylhydroperoxidase